ncbi:MAG: hypothetical protein B7Z37_09650 [Verrucomicrobia bacterium 12-59-8]|nr:MAG: hypothetical protein B7Z37_09650 [Verrucomicrobia bacterium 12-59-8]
MLMTPILSSTKILRPLPWIVGVIFSLPLLAYAVFDVFLTRPWTIEPATTVFFTPKQLDVAFDTAKALLPICTGYLIAAAPILNYLHKNRQLTRPVVIFGVVAIFGLGIIAVGLWTGVFAFLIPAANSIDRPSGIQGIDPAFLNNRYEMALFCARLAHLSFFASIVWFAATVIEIMFLEPEASKVNESNVA